MPQSRAGERAREAILPLLERRVETGFAPGLVALVGESENAEIVTAGMSSLESGKRMGSDTVFRIASMTKPVTAMAAMMLVEEGKLTLDAPVDALLPELSNLKVLRRPNDPLDDTVPARRPITLEDILTYRLGSGILFGSPDEYPILAAINERRLAGFGPPLPDEDYGPDEWMRRLGELPLMAQPGERWLYTAGSNVLGVLITRASGLSLQDFFRTRIFEPLGMADTAFFARPEKQSRLAESYKPTKRDLERYTTSPTAWKTPPRFPAGDAGLVSTAADFFAFSRFLLRRGLTGDGRRLLSESSVQAMTRDHLPPNSAPEASRFCRQAKAGAMASVLCASAPKTAFLPEPMAGLAGSARAGSQIPSTTAPSSSSPSAPSPARGISPRIARSCVRRTADLL